MQGAPIDGYGNVLLMQGALIDGYDNVLLMQGAPIDGYGNVLLNKGALTAPTNSCENVLQIQVALTHWQLRQRVADTGWTNNINC